MFAEQGLRMIAGLFVGLWVARYLGPEQFGIFSYSTAFVAIFAGIAKLGLDSILVRELVNHPEKANVYLGTAFWLKIFGAVTVFVIIATTTLLGNNDHTTNIYILIIASGIIFQSFEVIDFYFQSKVMAKCVSICKLTQLTLSSFLKVWFVLNGSDLLWFVIVSLIDQVSLALTLALAFHFNKTYNFYNKFDFKLATTTIRNSWPMILSGLAIALYMRLDQIMIQQILGNTEVGLYTAAIRLTEATYFIPVLVSTSLFPAIVSAKKISDNLYYKRLQQLFSLLVLISIVSSLGITLTSDWLIENLYGSSFKQASEVLILSAWSSVFVFLGVASGSWYTCENLQKLAFYRTLSGLILNVVLNIILIPSYGIKGAAIASLFSQAMAALFFDFFTKKTKMLFFMKFKAFYLKSLILNTGKLNVK